MLLDLVKTDENEYKVSKAIESGSRCDQLPLTVGVKVKTSPVFSQSVLLLSECEPEGQSEGSWIFIHLSNRLCAVLGAVTAEPHLYEKADFPSVTLTLVCLYTET